MGSANQAFEQTRDSVLRYGESVGCELLNFFVRKQNMKHLRILIVVLAGLVTGCGERQPAHPNVGLRVFLNGEEVGRYGFFMREPVVAPAGLRVKITPEAMKFSSGGHEVSIRWKADLAGAEDNYDLTITTDQAVEKRRVAYSGQPIVIAEMPFRIVMEDVEFTQPIANQGESPSGNDSEN